MAIDSAVEHLTQSMTAARDKIVPKLLIKGDLQLPRRIRSQIKIKNHLRRVALEESNPHSLRQLFSMVNHMQKCIKSKIQTLHDNVWNNKLSKVTSPNSDLWRIVKSVNHRPTTIPPLTMPNNATTSSELEQCEVLANAFLDNMYLTKHWVTDSGIEEAVKE